MYEIHTVCRNPALLLYRLNNRNRVPRTRRNLICRYMPLSPGGDRRSRPCPYVHVRALARPSDMAAACCPTSHPPSGLPRVLAQTAKLRDASAYSIAHPPPHCKSFCAPAPAYRPRHFQAVSRIPSENRSYLPKIKEPAPKRRFLHFCYLIARDLFRPESISSHVSIRASYHDFMPLENGFYNPQALSSHLLLSPRQVILPFSTVNKSVESSSLGS